MTQEEIQQIRENRRYLINKSRKYIDTFSELLCEVEYDYDRLNDQRLKLSSVSPILRNKFIDTKLFSLKSEVRKSETIISTIRQVISKLETL